jgi:hypothetical protein
MLAAIEWQSVHVAAAFVLGTIFGTVATIRVMRIIAIVFEEGPRRRRPPWRRVARDDTGGTDTPDEP